MSISDDLYCFQCCGYLNLFSTDYNEKMEKNCVFDDLTIVNDLKGRIGDGTHRMAAYPGEQRRHPRPLGPVAILRSAPKNISVEREIKCDPTQMSSVVFKVFPVAGPTGNSSTIIAKDTHAGYLRT